MAFVSLFAGWVFFPHIITHYWILMYFCGEVGYGSRNNLTFWLKKCQLMSYQIDSDSFSADELQLFYVHVQATKTLECVFSIYSCNCRLEKVYAAFG